MRRFYILAILLALTLSGCYRGSKPARIGTLAPDFTVQDSDRKITLSDYRGQIVVLNFWATWCPPCIEELPSLETLQQRMKDKGVKVLAISIDDDDNAYHQFLKDNKVDLLSARDASKKSNNLYGTFKFPETYIIDQKGIVRRKFIGAVNWNQAEIVDFLSKL
ncbi:MAG TPA: TlpA disulfide reductase family protein [Terriglobales bacterium]|nr:TlpA disulfide reductase family protein [Terriglobales bacterium]